MEMATFSQYLQPELFILIPVLYLIGVALKKAKFLANKYIPLTLGIVGVVTAVLYCFATVEPPADYRGVLMILFTAFTQGILCAGASVYVDQLVKQTAAKDK